MSGGALVLAAHGSRRDPAANALVRRLAQVVRERRLFDEVAAAFHQGEPGFDAVLDELGSEAVTVVPVMTSAGHYADVVLPEALARNRRHAELRLRLTPPVGSHPGIAPLVARRVSELLREYAPSRGRRRHCSSPGTAPGATRRAGTPRSSWRRRCAAAAWRGRWSPGSSTTSPGSPRSLAAGADRPGGRAPLPHRRRRARRRRHPAARSAWSRGRLRSPAGWTGAWSWWTTRWARFRASWT